MTVDGLIVREAMPGGSIAKVACWMLAPKAPVSVAIVAEPTDDVITVNFALEVEANTETAVGILAATVFGDNFTLTGPFLVPTVAFRVTTPATVLPPIVVDGETVTLEIWNGLTVSVPV